jgi:hypothetical protein
MKRVIFTIILAGSMLIGRTQITLHQSDIASPLTQLMMYNDTLPVESAGIAGTSQTWDFSAAHHSTTDTVIFTEPLWTLYGTSFPGSNLCVMTKSTSTSYDYLVSCSDSLNVAGLTRTMSGVFAKLHGNPTEKLLNFPSTYNDSFTNVSTYMATSYFGLYGFDSVKVKVVSTVKSTFDAYGSVKLGIGTYNCLRQNNYTISIDTIWGLADTVWANITSLTGKNIDTTRQYTWWTNNIGYGLVQMTVNLTTDSATSFSYLGALPTPGGINEIADNSIYNIYPNPAKDVINVCSDLPLKNASIELYDVTGSLLYSSVLNSVQSEISIANLANGIYYMKVKSDNKVEVKKFVKE